MSTDPPDLFRPLIVPEAGDGMRLDRFLSARFIEKTRSELARGIRLGQVTDDTGRPLRPAYTVRTGDLLRIYIPALAPTEPAPPLPPILYEDDRVIVLDKPPGLPCHPGGTKFTWAVVGLARDHWDLPHVDLVHRLDRETSGTLVLTKDAEANAILKQVFKEGGATKEYEALCRGLLPWETRTIDAPIGDADGPIRIQRAVRPDGLSARTDVTVLARRDHPVYPMTHVHVRLHTGRTHQIRVHLAHVADGLIGDRMYGCAPEVFLHYWDHGLDQQVIVGAGAPRHALHARRIAFPHPDGGTVAVEAPWPEDLARWWANPDVLPLDEPIAE